nr:uncharacterized protein LOC113806338 [Penaeus vannamei]
MPTNWTFPRLTPEGNDNLSQQDGASPHWHLAVKRSLNEHLPNRWIGRAEREDQVFWSPDLTAFDFFLWGYVKSTVYVPPLPVTLEQLNISTTETVRKITSYTVEYLDRTGLSRRCFPSNQRGRTLRVF